VTADTLIATITPDENDTSIKNLRLQQEALYAQLDNLEETYNMTEENFEMQKETLRAQTENTQDVYNQDNVDLEKLEKSIQNFKDQQENTILDAFKKIRDNASHLRNSNMYEDLYDDRYDIQDMSDSKFSKYLEDMADLTKKASSYASGDTMYAMFM